MVVDIDAQSLESFAIGHSACLAVVVCDDDGVDKESTTEESVPQTQHVDIIGDAEVAADFVFLDVDGTDNNDDFRIVFQLHKHFQLAVGLKARQYAAGVVIVEEFTTKFKIELIAELADAFLDVFGLYFQILVVVKSVFHDLFY